MESDVRIGSSTHSDSIAKRRFNESTLCPGKNTNLSGVLPLFFSCVTHPPEETPENAAFLEIFQLTDGKEKQKVFSGWMFASSPALSALDHPVYDIWVLRCESSTASKSR